MYLHCSLFLSIIYYIIECTKVYLEFRRTVKPLNTLFKLALTTKRYILRGWKSRDECADCLSSYTYSCIIIYVYTLMIFISKWGTRRQKCVDYLFCYFFLFSRQPTKKNTLILLFALRHDGFRKLDNFFFPRSRFFLHYILPGCRCFRKLFNVLVRKKRNGR